jgi:hypothetical protein
MQEIKDYENDELPFEIDYNIERLNSEQIEKINNDWNNISYNNHYFLNAEKITLSKISCEFDHISGFNLVIQKMIQKLQLKTPLKELEKIKCTHILFSKYIL